MAGKGAQQGLVGQKAGGEGAQAASLLDLGAGLVAQVCRRSVAGPARGIRGPAGQELGGELLRLGGQYVGGVAQHSAQALQRSSSRAVVKLPLQGGDAGGVELGLQPGAIQQQAIELVLAAGRREVVADPAPGVGVGQLVGIAPGIDQAGMGLGQCWLAKGLAEEGAQHIVEADLACGGVELQQGGLGQLDCQAAAVAAVQPPKLRGHRQRDRFVFWKHRQPLIVRLLFRGQPFEAELQRLGDGGVAVAGGVAIPAGDAPLGEVFKDGRQGLSHAAAQFDQFGHGTGRQPQQQGPFPQRLGQGLEGGRVWWGPGQPGREHGHRFAGAHLIHQQPFGLHIGGHLQQATGDQPCTARASAQEGFQMGRIPDVVDDDQAVLALQPFRQAGGGVFGVFEGWPLAGEAGMELGQGIGQIGRLAQGGPEDAVVEGLDDGLVVAKCCGQGGFAEAAGTGEGGGDRHRIFALTLQQQSPQRLELLGALHEADW